MNANGEADVRSIPSLASSSAPVVEKVKRRNVPSMDNMVTGRRRERRKKVSGRRARYARHNNIDRGGAKYREERAVRRIRSSGNGTINR